MDVTITSQNKQEYLLIESKGFLQTKEDLFMHSQMVYGEIMKHGSQKILINQPETHFPLELFPYFGLVQDYIDNYPAEIRYLKIAIVVADEYKQVAESWESLCVSRGLQYFAFTSLEEASTWLLG
jgi:hypothetical protein